MSKLSNLEFFRKVAETGEAPAEGSRFIYPPTIAKTLGFRLIEVGPGTATMELMADGFAQKVRNSTDEVGGWLILNLLSSWRNGTNTTDEVGGFFIPDLHANTPSL